MARPYKPAPWRAISINLLTSTRWQSIDDPAARLWVGILLTTDAYGATSGDADMLRATALKKLRWTRRKVEKALDVLEGSGLIERYIVDGDEWVQITNFDTHQHPEFLRKRAPRKSPDPSHGRVTSSDACDSSYTDGPAHGRDYQSLPSEASYSNNRSNSLGTPYRSIDQDVKAVYDHWVTVDTTATGSAGRRKLNAKRQALITARLREGYSVEDLCNAITAFCDDDWHRGKNPRGVAYTGIATLLKSGDKVEDGMRRYEQAQREPSDRFTRFGKVDHVVA